MCLTIGRIKVANSPDLAQDGRLADVIAAVQAVATYKFYKLDFKGWADRITGNEENPQHWKTVFEDHPEFFRLDSKKKRASLVWRRQHQRLYDVDQEKKISREEYDRLPEDRKRKRISRTPLDSDEIGMLVKTAIELHSLALDRKKDSRWWISVVVGLAGVIVGAAITTFNT